MRFHPTRGAMSLGASKGGLPPDSCCEEEPAALREMEAAIKTYHDNSKCAPAAPAPSEWPCLIALAAAQQDNHAPAGQSTAVMPACAQLAHSVRLCGQGTGSFHCLCSIMSSRCLTGGGHMLQ